MQTVQVHLTNLSVDAFNPRKTHDSDAITQLANGIQQIGIVSPLVVRPELPPGVEPFDPTSMRYTVLCGSRRLAAARQVGLTVVPCIVRELTDAEAAAVALTEQESHETLHFLERADHYLKWRDAGATADEIGERMGQKRATVYFIIAMAEKLTPEARQACFESRLNETIARKLATVPRSAQDAALKKLLEPGANGPLTTREAEEVLDGFRRDLSKAPFDPKDPTLACCEHSGSCEDCPLRSGTQPELFSDVKNENLCTSPDGYKSKADADWARRVLAGEQAQDTKCLPEEQTNKYFNGIGALRDDAPYVEANSICYADTAQRTYKSLLGPGYKRHIFLARDPKKLDVVELVGKEGLASKLEEVGKIKHPPAAFNGTMGATKKDDGEKQSAEEKRKHAEKVKRRQLSIRKALALIAKRVASRGAEKKTLRFVAESMIRQGAMPKTMGRLDIKDEKHLDRRSENELWALLLEGSAEFELYGDKDSDKWPPMLKELAQLLGVDLADAEREVVAEEKAAPVKKEKAKTKEKRA